MTDEELAGVWATLEPGIDQERRVDRQVFAWLDAHDTSLAAEWLGLVQAAPFSAVGLATASAIALLVAATPVLWVARALAGALL